MNDIKPIETHYKGYRFRSRLEARWAVFFDTAGIKWEYESEGYQQTIGWNEDGTPSEFVKYLPDFFLPRTSTFVEVKGSNKLLKDCKKKYESFLDWNSQLPKFCDSSGSRHGLIVLGPIPESIWGIILHPIIQHHKGLIWNWMCFYGNDSFRNIQVFSEDYQIDNLRILGLLTSKTEPKEWTIDCERIKTPRAFSKVVDAYKAARSARFEFGESG